MSENPKPQLTGISGVLVSIAEHLNGRCVINSVSVENSTKRALVCELADHEVVVIYHESRAEAKTAETSVGNQQNLYWAPFKGDFMNAVRQIRGDICGYVGQSFPVVHRHRTHTSLVQHA